MLLTTISLSDKGQVDWLDLRTRIKQGEKARTSLIVCFVKEITTGKSMNTVLRVQIV